MKKKKNNLTRILIFICIIVIIIELIAMFIMHIIRERNIDHIDIINDLIEVDNGYVAVGVSDFVNSKTVSKKIYEYTDSTSKDKMSYIANQSKIAMYDNSMKMIWENTFENQYDSTFYSVLKVEDGYIAVGSVVSKYEQIEAKTRDALIAKYDLSGKLLWHKLYSVLSDTEFYKIIDDGEDNYIVVGQSIYENFEMGSHITGGGIIVRYDKDGNVLAHNNYGGNKSGSFNDVIKVNDGYIVCGKDAVNYGILVKFKNDFNRDEKDNELISKKILWQRTYSNTDEVGFTQMLLNKDIIYLIGAINVSSEKDKDDKPVYQYVAGIVSYNISGKYLDKYSFESSHNRFNSAILENNQLFLTALLNVDGIPKGEKQDSMVVKFDLEDNKYIDKKIYQNDTDYIINKIVKLNKNILIGSSKTKCSLYGCEYEPLLVSYN